MKFKTLLIAALGAASLLTSCKDMFDEDCNYLSYIRADLQPDSIMATVPFEDFIMTTFPDLSLATGQDWHFDDNGSCLAAVHTGPNRNGDVRILYYNPEDYKIRNRDTFEDAELYLTPKLDEDLGEEVLKTPKLPAGMFSEKITTITEDTVFTKPQIEAVTQSLRVRVNFYNTILFPDLSLVKGMVSGTLSGRKISTGNGNGEYYPTLLAFETEGEDDTIYHGVPDTWTFSSGQGTFEGVSSVADILTFGTIGATEHEILLLIDYGPEIVPVRIDVDEALNSWRTPYREIIINVKLGEKIGDIDFDIQSWNDGEDLEIEVLPDM